MAPRSFIKIPVKSPMGRFQNSHGTSTNLLTQMIYLKRIFKQRCPRNPVFGARDPGRKTFFLKDPLQKMTMIFKIFPCGAKLGPAGQA